MRNALSLKVLSGMLVLVAAGCSGGGTDDAAASLRIRCNGGESFCLISCDLGCSQTGCSVTEIAENQRLRFVFSDRIAVASVNSASISIRTPSGVAPDGEFLVSDRELTFAPRVRTVNGVSTFGFHRNESYVITLASGELGQGIRSVSGDSLSREFSCTVVASRGIQDEDQLPPTAVLTSPTNPNQSPANPVIVLQFSELIDTTALQGVVGDASPIQYVLRGTVSVGGLVVCDRDQEGIALEGVPQLSTQSVGGRSVTVVSFQPTVQLPGNSCVTVNVTADVRDLSGRQAVPTSFQLLTVAGVSQSIPIVETFTNSANQDLAVSTTEWLNGARPGLIGNDGRHGSFAANLGTQVGPSDYQWNTDSFLIPANRSLTGQEYLVTDGKFYFTDFTLPEGTTLRFTGSVPPQIWVRGNAEIRGAIRISGADMPFWVPTSGLAIGQRVQDFNARGTTASLNYVNGQPGGAGGIGGGRGGKGGNECQLNGDFTVNGVHVYYGENGQDVRVAAGHAYWGQAAGTGGKGSLLHPITGLAVNTPLLGSLYRAQFAPGGSGGGFSGPGGLSSVNPLPAPPALPVVVTGPIPVAGAAFPWLTPVPNGTTSLDHFLVGGSGGGGGGSHEFGTLNTPAGDVYIAGSGGTGGGGALALRVGANLVVANTAVLESKGGQGVLITGDDRNSVTPDANWGVSSPGGGGSGGSFLLQAGGTLAFNGTIDVSGAQGSRTGSIQNTTLPASTVINIISQAGNGAPGFYRLEAGAAVPTFGGTGLPAPAAGNMDLLTDRDAVTGSASKWRSSQQIFPPQWLRYELEVDVDGDGTAETFYTDSNQPGTQRANDPNGPVRIMFQGARLNQAGTEPLPGEVGPWRDGIGNEAGPGIALDSATGFRFMITFNTAQFPSCVVRVLRVFAQT